MRERMDQAEINALLKDSMFEDSSIHQSQSQSNQLIQCKRTEPDQYANDEFESYDESHATFKNSSNTINYHPNSNTKIPIQKPPLQPIRQQPPLLIENKINSKKGKPKNGIYFQEKPAKRNSTSREAKTTVMNPSTSLKQRELIDSLTFENRKLREDLKNKDNQYKRLESIYRTLLKEKSQQAPSVRQTVLQKQLTDLHSKYLKLQQLCKLEKSKHTFKATKTNENFIPQNTVNEREEELCNIIEQLRDRLLTTNNELKTLQAKMNEGENYVDELRKKLRRIEQLQFKMEKMTEQAENDRGFIEMLKGKNRKLEEQLAALEKENKFMAIEVHRLKLGDSTQKDCFSELEQIRKQKEVLERNLKEITSNLMKNIRTGYKESNKIEDSGELLRP